MRVTASCTGSCGELIQGWLGDSQKLVSYGIDRFSKVTLQTGIASKGAKPKIEKAINKTLDHLRIPNAKREKLSFVINSELPIAKGMASSTADIAAACQATAAYYRRKITRDEIIDICLAIERTDSILFPTLTLFEQKNGLVREQRMGSPFLRGCFGARRNLRNRSFSFTSERALNFSTASTLYRSLSVLCRGSERKIVANAWRGGDTERSIKSGNFS